MENVFVKLPKTYRPPLAATLFFLIVAALLLTANAYFLWKPRADQVSGDTLIHLVYARNFLEGRAFEFNVGHSSRALTAPLWNWVLAAAGAFSGTAGDPEGFLLAFRGLAIGVTLGALFAAWRLSGRLGAGPLWSAAVVLVLATNPSVFYWTVSNPMETPGACLAALLLIAWVLRASCSSSPLLWFAGGALSAAGFLVRPELVVFGLIAGLAAFVCSVPRSWKSAALFAVGLGAGLGLWILCMVQSGLSVLPNAGSARRLMLLLDDASPLPVLGWPWSPDCLLFLGLFFPFVLGVASGVFSREREVRAVCLAVMAITCFSVAFFTFYFPTTWQGRYVLPVVFLLVPVGAARFAAALPALTRSAVVATVSVYSAIIAFLILRPLAIYADGPHQRSLPRPEFVSVPPGANSILCQEIQSAWFHPELFHVCTEGLIGLESLEARKRGLSVIEFIHEQRPDLIGTGRYPLRDPECVVGKIKQAAENREDVVLPGVELTYLGEMAGCGSVFTPRWASSPNPTSPGAKPTGG